MKKAIKVAISEGAAEVEVFGVRSRTLSMYLDDDLVKNVEEKMDQGMAVRVIKAKKVGQSSTTVFNIREVEHCAQTAVKLANVSAPDPVFKGFAASRRGNLSPNCYDRDLATLMPDSLTHLGREVVSTTKEEGKVKLPSGLFRTAVMQTLVMNTSGAETENRSTMFYTHCTSMTQGQDPGEGVGDFYSPHLKSFDPASFGADLRQRAIDAQRAEHYKGHGTMDVILPPHELAELLSSTASFALSAENVHKKRSAWANKVGERVASAALTLSDDPFDERGMLSCGYDDEGARTTQRTLVDRGILKGYLYDQYNALFAGVPSTGNALRRSPMDSQNVYRMPLDIGPINLVMEPGNKSQEEMVAETEHGMLIGKLASAEANPITGAFGLEVRCAYEIEKGEVKRTVDHALLTGNMFQTLQNVRQVGKDQTVFRSCILPAVTMAGMEIIGSE